MQHIDGTEHMMNDIEHSIYISNKVIRNILNDRAEEYAERYVSQNLNLGDDNPQKQTIKQQYIEIYKEKIIELIK